MSEQQDYVALDWVASEIKETLNEANQALEAYIGNRDDATKLRFCLTHIHQVHGTLHMVEFFGAALLAEEMENLTQALAQGSIHESHVEDALSVLKNSLEQLPVYLEKVKESRSALPATLLPVLNDLRAVRGESLFSETALFSPTITTEQPSAEPAELVVQGEELKTVTHKLRQMFQIALLGLIRGQDVKKNLNYLAKACARLSKLTSGRPPQPLWRVCIAVLEGLLNGSIDASVSVKILLRHVDRQIKNIINEGESALDTAPPEDLLKNLLYYVARSKANSRFIKEIKEEYKLDSSLLGKGELEDDNLAAPDAQAMNTVVLALAQELNQIKDQLQEAGTNTDMLTDALPSFRRVSDTMAILGMGAALKPLQDQHSELARLLATQDTISQASIDIIIEKLTALEGDINPGIPTVEEVATDEALFNDSEEAQEQLDSAFDSVVLESRNGLEQAKESIIEFVATQWDHNCLTELPELLSGIRGSLAMVPLTRAANIILSCENYVNQELIGQQSVPEWQMLDTLADAITSVDYYLERMIDRSPEDKKNILDVAAESVAELGYPVAGEETTVNAQEELADSAAPEVPVLDTELPTLDESVPVLESEDETADIEIPTIEASDDIEIEVEGEADDDLTIELESSSDEIGSDEENSSDQDAPVLAEVIPIQGNQEEMSEQSDEATDAEETAAPVQAGTGGEPQPLAALQDEEFDDEIAEIFVEEAREVLETIEEYFPQWVENQSDEEIFTTIRRAFHTLKGSGRMAKAVDLGEMAWSVENMLNRVIDGTLVIDPQRLDLVAEAKSLIPEMVNAFENRLEINNKPEVEYLKARAFALEQEQNPDLSTIEAPQAEEANVEIDVPVLEPSEEVSELAAVESTEPEVVVEAEGAGEVEDEEDHELLSIFAAEALVHLESLDGFLSHCKEVGGPVEMTDELQRALHTLKGSTRMAGVDPIATVVVPLEHMVKELRASQLKTDAPVIEILQQGSLFIKVGIEQLETTPKAPLPGVDDYLARLDQVRDERLAMAGTTTIEDSGITPEAEANFLGQALDLLSDASDELGKWKEGALESGQTPKLAETMSQLIVEAGKVNMSAVVELGEAMQVLYRRAAQVDGSVPGNFFTVADQGNEALIDMLDQVAGHQSPTFDQALMQSIQDFEFPVAAEDLEAELTGVVIDVPELTDELEQELEDAQVDGSEKEEIEEGLRDIAEVMAEMVEAVADPIDADNADAIANKDTDITIDASDDGLDIEIDASQLESQLEADIPDLEIDLPDEDLTEEIVAEDSAEEVAEEPEVEIDISAQEPEVAAEPEPMTAEDEDDEVDAEILEIFMEEADDLLEAIDESIHNWQDDRQNRAHLDDLLRHLHTLKGGARLSGLTVVGDLSHNFETYLEAVGEDKEIDDAFLAEIQQFQDDLISKVEAISSGELESASEPATPEPPVVEVEVETSVETPEEPVAEIDVEAPVEDVQEEETEIAAEIIEETPIVAEVEEPEITEADEEIAGEVLPFDEAVEKERPVIEKGDKSTIVPFAPKPNVAAEAIAESVINSADPSKKGPQEVIKVSANLLEDLVNLAGETSISRGRAEEQISELVFSLEDMQITVDRLQEQVRRLDMETEQQILYRQEQVESEGLEGFDPLEMDRYSQLQQLSRSLLESSSDLIDIKSTLADKSRDMETLLAQQSRINTELQEGLMRSRMVPFSRMVPRLRRIVRQISGELDKKVDFRLDNVEGELDRTVLERMVAPLEHMLRNAVDHGIESAEERAKAGKNKRGTVALNLAREGGEIVLTLSDDGAGVNLDAVKAKAVERGLMNPGQELTEREITQFILAAGFSTAETVTQISGRGVGMDVVHSEIKQLGGSMEIESVAGQGTRFIVRLPFTVSVNRALMVSVGGNNYAIPLNTIEGIVRVSPFELEAYYQPDAPMFEYAGQPYLLRYMGGFLQRGEKPILEGHTMPLPVILVRGAEHSVAVQVDGLLGSREIVVKPLGPQFSMVQGLSGATVLGDGNVVVILDLLAMIRADAMQLYNEGAESIEDHSEEEERNVLVMVVDDSVTVRKVTSRFLERQGMDVILAKDGMDAVTQLNEIERIPDVMLLDIEMPRMDGFEVATRVRHTSRLENIPIIMITSRTGEKHRERALSIGVDNYLGKPYQETELLAAINELTGVASE